MEQKWQKTSSALDQALLKLSGQDNQTLEDITVILRFFELKQQLKRRLLCYAHGILF